MDRRGPAPDRHEEPAPSSTPPADPISPSLVAASRQLRALLEHPGEDAGGRLRTAIAHLDEALGELHGRRPGEGVPDGSAGTRADVLPLAVTAELVAANVGDAVIVADARGHYEWASPSSVQVTGWQPQDLVGRSMFEFVHPDDEALLHGRWAEQVAGAPLVGVEFRCLRPDGGYRWVEGRIRPLRGATGRVTGSITSLRDVAERHRLQERLTEALETFELSFAAAPIGKALVAADGRWLKVNPALSAITGRSQGELLSGSFQDITHPDDLDADLRLVEEVLRGARAGYEIEKRYLRPDGREVWVLLNVAGARRRDGTFRFFIVQVQDISRRKADALALQHRADHDALTGLWNRRRFTDELTACSAAGRRDTDRPVLLALDLDG